MSARFLRDRWFWLLLGCGLAVRLGLSVARPELLREDADGYLAHAVELAARGEFVGPFTGVRTAFRPPGYVCLLAVGLWLGLSPSATVLAVHLMFTNICVAATAGLATIAGLSRVRVLIAASCVVFDPLLVRYSVQPMSEVPCAALLVLGVLLFVRAMSSSIGTAERAGWVAWGLVSRRELAAFFSGLLFAAGSLIRPAVLPAAVLCLGAFAVTRWGGDVTCLRERWDRRSEVAVGGGWFGVPRFRGALLACAFGLVLGLMPWVWRNAVVFGAFIPATTHGGYTLALGNNPDFYRDVIHQPAGSMKNGYPWRGEALEGWQRRTLDEAAAAGVALGDEVALDAWYYDYAWASIGADWGGFLQACGLRFVRFWAFAGAGAGGLEFWLPCVWYGCLWLGLVPALLRLLTGRVAPVEICVWLSVAAFCGLHLCYWTDARMRAPLMPLLAVLGAMCPALSFRRG